MNKYCMLALPMLAASSVWAATPNCAGLMTDPTLSDRARTGLAAQCQQAACEQEAVELKLTNVATDRFMKQCLAEGHAPISGEAKQAAHPTVAVSSEANQPCTQSAPCMDLSTELEAAAAGLQAGERANSGHTFVRVPRISEADGR